MSGSGVDVLDRSLLVLIDLLRHDEALLKGELFLFDFARFLDKRAGRTESAYIGSGSIIIDALS